MTAGRVERSAGAEAGAERRVLRIATRGSDLALWQANFVKNGLERHGHTVELVLVETQGDRDGRPFGEMTGQGFFTKAVQDALLDGRADIAVHSHKDLPSAPTPGLEIAAVPTRADARDVLLVRPDAWSEDASRADAAHAAASRGDAARTDALRGDSSGASATPSTSPTSPFPLIQGASVGTSAARRRRQLTAARPDLVLRELRGNVPTRVQKLRDGAFDAVVLAAAGLDRLELDLHGLHRVVLEPHVLVPAPAQGALALEVRREDYDLASTITDLHDPYTYRTVAAERGLMAMLQGGCQLALGAHAVFEGGQVKLRAWYEGTGCRVEHPSSEGAAMLAYDALGRPAPRSAPGASDEAIRP